MNKPVSKEREAAIIESIASGRKYELIAEQFGVSKSAIAGFAKRRGLNRNNHKLNVDVQKILDFVLVNEEVYPDRRELRDALSNHMGYPISREYFNNILSRHGITRPKIKEEAVRSRIGELGLDAFGGPSYGDEVDKAFFELLETDDEPPAWLLEAYEPWLKARCEWVRSQRREEVEQ